MLVQPEK